MSGAPRSCDSRPFAQTRTRRCGEVITESEVSALCACREAAG